MAVGALFTVVWLVDVVSATLASAGDVRSPVTGAPGVAAGFVLCGLSVLAVGGTLLWGLR